jgi:hypothetical protein
MNAALLSFLLDQKHHLSYSKSEKEKKSIQISPIILNKGSNSSN